MMDNSGVLPRGLNKSAERPSAKTPRACQEFFLTPEDRGRIKSLDLLKRIEEVEDRIVEEQEHLQGLKDEWLHTNCRYKVGDRIDSEGFWWTIERLEIGSNPKNPSWIAWCNDGYKIERDAQPHWS